MDPTSTTTSSRATPRCTPTSRASSCRSSPGPGEEPDLTGQSEGATRVTGVSIQHTPATRLWFGKVRNLAGYRSVPHHHGEAETGGYVLSGRARIYFGEKFEDYLDMSEGDWVFVPPFMPHVECNLDRNNPLTWMTTRTPGEHRGQPARRSTTPTCATGRTDRDRRVDAVADLADLHRRGRADRVRAPRSSTAPSPRPPSRARGPRPTAATWSPRRSSPPSLTVSADGKTLHSMHSYFMRPVDIGAEVRYEVEVLRDGRGYSTRQVRGFQNGKPVYVCLAELRGRRAERQLPAPMPPPTCPRPTTCRRSADVPRRTAPAAR